MSEDLATKPHGPPDWSEEEIGILRAGVEAGHPAGLIACNLPGRTRNAVLGYIHRHRDELPERPKLQSAPNPPGRITPAANNGRRGAEAGVITPRPPTPTPTPPQPRPIVHPVCDEPVEPIGQRCGILELTDDKCRWPIGDPHQPDFFFCGGRALAGLPYCGFHARIAYAPVADRRREARLAERAPA